jgi:hypothetical protein
MRVTIAHGKAKKSHPTFINTSGIHAITIYFLHLPVHLYLAQPEYVLNN